MALRTSVEVLLTVDMPMAHPAAEDGTDVHEGERLLPPTLLWVIPMIRLTLDRTTSPVAKVLTGDMTGTVLEDVDHGV